MPALISVVIAQAIFAQLAFSQQKRDTPTCAGVYFENDGTSGCCVGGTLPPVILSTCAGWPVCTGPVTTTTTETPISCVTIVDATDAQYTSKIDAASSSMAVSGTHYQSGLTIENAVTDAPSTDAPSTDAPSTDTPSTDAAATSNDASTTASSAAAASTGSTGSSDAAVNAIVPVMGTIGGAILALAAVL